MTMQPSASGQRPFRRPGETLPTLDAGVAAKVVAAASDLALVLDRHGVVRDLSVNGANLQGADADGWVDRPWIDTVTSESRLKVAEVLSDAASGKASRWREINHPGADGETVLIRYFAVNAGAEGDIIVVGRDMHGATALQHRLLKVQQAVERDYLRLRQAESRYRLLFQTTSEAVLIVDAATRRIREANPAAERLTGSAQPALAGRALKALLEADGAEAADALLAAASSGNAPSPVRARLAGGALCDLGASVFRQDRATYVLVRLTLADAARPDADGAGRLQTVLDRIPDGFVVTDADLRILTVNTAFVEVAQLSGVEAAIGQSLDRFLGRPAVDMKLLVSQLREHGAVRNFATVLRGLYGGSEEVEVSAVSVEDAEPPYLGFTVRSVGSRALTRLATGGGSARSVEELTQLIGRMPMKDIVRESTDLIERLCIEAALTLSSNNRAFAADLLGLSRQGLYGKLNRYGLGGPAETEN